MISIIIPIYNEEETLRFSTEKLSGLSVCAELIFVNGGSNDRSADIAREYGKVLSCEKGRGRQMNVGAREARNDILLFLHADNAISPEVLRNIEKTVCDNGVVGGCLTQRIENGQPVFRLIEWQGNNRARRTKVFYGDQGIFVRKDVFEKLGGFPDVPIFEDVLFTRRLRFEGKTTVLPNKIMVSARRWKKRGIIRTTVMYNRLLIMFKMGYPLKEIKKLYEDLR